MKNCWRYLGQGVAYALFIAFIGYFSSMPSYTNMPANLALIKLTFTHAGQRVHPIKDTRTKEEMAALPPQLRARKHSRERSPLTVEFKIDGKMLYQAEIPSRGMSHDLPSPVYQRFTVPAGSHHFSIRMNDDLRQQAFNYSAEKTITLAPLQTLVIDFDNIRKAFIFE